MTIDLMKNLSADLESVTSEAIAEHEASRWKKYPENEPEIGEMYNVSNGKETCIAIYSGYAYFEVESIRIPGIIAFRELPKPYQP